MCLKCVIFEIHNIYNICECEKCELYETHKENSKDSRNLMHIDAKKTKNNTESVVAAVDMQKIITIPKLSLKDSHFKDKISVYNQSFCGIGKNENSLCIVSNDTEIEKTSLEFINFTLKFLSSEFCKNSKEVILWSDNCTGQNKNKNTMPI